MGARNKTYVVEHFDREKVLERNDKIMLDVHDSLHYSIFVRNNTRRSTICNL
jgi:hypothetical protein